MVIDDVGFGLEAAVVRAEGVGLGGVDWGGLGVLGACGLAA